MPITEKKLRLRRRFLYAAVALVGAHGVQLQAHAQAQLSDRPIQLVVPFAPGGGNDVLARLVADPLGQAIERSVIVENKSGAGGNIGASFVVRAPADGHTLLLATNTLTLNPFLIKSLPFEVTKDLAPVAVIANQPIVVVTNASVPVSNMKELAAWLTENEGKVFYASPGNGTPHHFAAELFKQTAGVNMAHVPYRGASPALTALVAGDVQVMFASLISALPFIREGRIKALATAEGRRLASLESLPTIKESGFPSYEATIWAGLMAPAGTPEPVLKKLSDSVVELTARPEVAARLKDAGFEVNALGSQQMHDLILLDLQRWGKVAENMNITSE